ncbi:MAG: hypothetical protein LBJ78_02195 [Puniceicoccales bacterium]|jgi:transketolase|nr:hypothetical protein [Puniceicoccales bacterium]
MRDAFIDLLRQSALKDPRIILITGDLGFGVLDRYRAELPHQFINAGIAEQNMTGLATGLALEGYRVFTYSIGNFCSLRCLEQIRNDVCYHNANVKIISIGSGLGYGALGMSHHATEDVSILRALPNLHVYSPSDLSEVKVLIGALMSYDGPAYVRLGKVALASNSVRTVAINDCNRWREPRLDVSCILLTHGTTATLAQSVCEQLPFNCEVYTIPCIKPLPDNALYTLLKGKRLVVTIEEHTLLGGFGSAIGEYLLDKGITVPLYRFGLPDQFITVGGTSDELRKFCGLEVSNVVATIQRRFQQ